MKRTTLNLVHSAKALEDGSASPSTFPSPPFLSRSIRLSTQQAVQSEMSVSTRAAKATYHPGGYGVSEGLKRARRPFRTANFITGSLITGFALSVYLYSIRAVAQDDFSDLDQPVSDDIRKGVWSIEDEKRAKEALVADRLAAFDPVAPAAVVDAVGPVEALPVAAAPRRTGILGLMQRTFGGKGTESKIVWGAPNVDRVGRIGEDAPVQAYSGRLV